MQLQVFRWRWAVQVWWEFGPRLAGHSWAIPAAPRCPHWAWTGISNSQHRGVTNGEQRLGVQEGSYRWRKMLLHLVTENLWNVLCFFLQCAGFVFQHSPQQIPRPALSSALAFQCLLTFVTIELLMKKMGKAVRNWLQPHCLPPSQRSECWHTRNSIFYIT